MEEHERLQMSTHDSSIVAISFALGFIGAYTAINLCDQFRICRRESPKLLSPKAFMIFMAISIGVI
jgi:NO-binding membrane sensor protein with MHYT domain